jgi:hypothetical protein
MILTQWNCFIHTMEFLFHTIFHETFDKFRSSSSHTQVFCKADTLRAEEDMVQKQHGPCIKIRNQKFVLFITNHVTL